MNRSILIKVAVALLVVILLHSVFWFFKTGQLEKHLNNFVTENNTAISAAEIKVAGYPFSQKIVAKDLKFTIPNSAFSKYQIIVKDFEASAGIFSKDFTVDVADKITVQDLDGNIGNVEFAQMPKISFSISDGIVSSFSYADNGYKIFDIDKNIIYSAASSTINLVSTIDSSDQITSKLNVAVREIEGFDVIDIYRNSSEKKIIDGIKTGEISLGSGAAVAMIGSDPSFASNAANPAAPNAPVVVPTATSDSAMTPPASAPSPAAAAANAAKAAASAQQAAAPNGAPVAGAAPVAAAPNQAPVVGTPADIAAKVASGAAIPSAAAPAAVPGVAAANVATQTADAAKATIDPSKPAALDVASLIAKSDVTKSNLIIDIEYVLTPTKNDQQGSVPLDPAQMQENATQYSRVVKVNNIEFSNALYKISLNGQVNYFQDDNLPSGFVTVKIENIDKFVEYVATGFTQIVEQKQIVPSVQSNDLAAQSSQTQSTAYQDFLRKISASLGNVSKELADKNQLTKDNVALFDMRREKNLEFIINETPLREVLGKF